MSRYYSYINSAATLLAAYSGEEPYASYLKKYFGQHKKFGSSDRKQVTNLCYCFFRLGKALPDIAVEERILLSLFLCSREPNKNLQVVKPIWNEQVSLSFSDKLKLTGHDLPLLSIFPWHQELSEAIDTNSFILSHLQQPDLFLRVRPGNEKSVSGKLNAAKIPFQMITDHCIALPNATKVDSILAIDAEAVIQDYSSQWTGEFLKGLNPALSKTGIAVWDCCAASGGKSIMAKDMLGDIELTVSDVRESILANLKKRFAAAKVNRYQSFVADLTQPVQYPGNKNFNLIIADLPCTGSGTWGRTPEQLYYFDKATIDDYAALQKRILSTIITHLAPGGYLLYITCSVFKKENEEAVAFITENFPLAENKTAIIKGYDKKADTMFASLLTKAL